MLCWETQEKREWRERVRQTDRQTERQRERESESERQKETHREELTHTHTHTHTHTRTRTHTHTHTHTYIHTLRKGRQTDRQRWRDRQIRNTELRKNNLQGVKKTHTKTTRLNSGNVGLGNSSTVRFAPQRKNNQTATYGMDEMQMEPKKTQRECLFLPLSPSRTRF